MKVKPHPVQTLWSADLVVRVLTGSVLALLEERGFLWDTGDSAGGKKNVYGRPLSRRDKKFKNQK